ncbi:MAG: DUF5723 family protein [Rikenellaceae bacterium]
MKTTYKLTLAATFAVAALSASAQSTASYFMPRAVERTQHNAAFAPTRGYFNIPLVGSTSVGVAGNIAISDFLVPSPDGGLATIFDTSISAADALSGLKTNNTTGLESRIGILGFGRYNKENGAFWSVDMALKTTMNMSMPYSMVDFFKNAPAQSTIEDLNMYMESYVETSFGYSRQLFDDRLVVGARAKVLLGLMNAEFNIDRMDVSMNSTEWAADATGTFSLNASGMTMEADENGEMDLGSIEGTPDGIAGVGFGLDLGATFDFSDRIQFSLAVNDLGFMSWKAGANTSASVANNFVFSGAEYDANKGEVTGSSDIEFADIVLEEEESKGTTNSLQSSIVMGGNYEILDNFLSAGLVYDIDFWKSTTMHTLSGVVTFTPISLISVAASYAFTNNLGNTVGLAANLSLGFLDLYLASDVLFSKKSTQYIPINQSSMNFTLGLSVPFGSKGDRNL